MAGVIIAGVDQGKADLFCEGAGDGQPDGCRQDVFAGNGNLDFNQFSHLDPRHVDKQAEESPTTPYGRGW